MRHLSTGCNAVSPRQNIRRADHSGVMRIATRHAPELRLRAAIVGRHMATARRGLTGVLRRHRNKLAAVPLELVVQLPAKLGPALFASDRTFWSDKGLPIGWRNFAQAHKAIRHKPSALRPS
jgi:hypothetical protein